MFCGNQLFYKTANVGNTPCRLYAYGPILQHYFAFLAVPPNSFILWMDHLRVGTDSVSSFHYVKIDFT